MKRLAKKLVALLSAALMLSAATAYAADAELVSCKAYMKNGTAITTSRFLRNAARFEMEIKNSPTDDSSFSMILVSFDSNGICKGVEILEPVPSSETGATKLTMPVNGSGFTGVSMVQCIAVEIDETGMYPLFETVNQLNEKGWS